MSSTISPQVETVALDRLRQNLRTYREKVRTTGASFVISYREEPVAVFAPFVESENQEGKVVELSSSQFRDQLTDCWARLSAGKVDVYVINVYSRPFAIFRRVRPTDLEVSD